MIHHATSGFWECYQRLPTAIQQLADKNYEILKVDPDHPSLHLKRLVRTAQFESELLTALLALRTGVQSFGFGLATMMNMNG